jgi:hypothetical protein
LSVHEQKPAHFISPNRGRVRGPGTRLCLARRTFRGADADDRTTPGVEGVRVAQPPGTRWVTRASARKRRTSRGHRHHGGPWSTATAKETPIANVGVAVRRRVERKLLSTENQPAKVAMDRMNPTP